MPKQIRLPHDIEWTIAAGGDLPKERYPWDKPGRATADVNEIIKHANIAESKINSTTPVNQYPEGKSPFGVMDMAGNVWEWQANIRKYKIGKEDYEGRGLRGGSWVSNADHARVSLRLGSHPGSGYNGVGFRVFVSLPREASL
jgi:formylglycine-generating enzyme required for sulfatase activity